MKIRQNLENGKLEILLPSGRIVITQTVEGRIDELEDIVLALMDFVSEQAEIIFTLKKSFLQMSERLEKLENKANEVNQP